MPGARTLLYRSIRAALDPCSSSTRFYGSFRNVPRFSFLCLPTVSDLFNKYRATDWPLQHMGRRQDRISALSPISHYLKCRTDSSTEYSIKSSEQNRLMNTMLYYQCTSFPSSISARSHIRAYSSHAVGKNDGLQNASEVSSNVATASTDKATDSAGNDWVDFLNQSYQAVVDAVVNAGKKVKEVSDEVVAPYMQQLYDAHPYLESVIVPVGGTLSATILAWVVMPKILRKFHKFARQSPFTLLAGSSTKKEAPYERSLWSALEDPARYLVTFMAFSQLSVMIVPSVSQYLSQVWRGAVVLSFIWFLHRWKTNFFARTLANEVSVGLDRDRLLQLENISSVGLLVLGVMALAEACGVAVQSILTVGGIGGVATAFASRDILGNVFSGLSLQFSRPFSVGDNIKAGLVEGQVVEMGLTTTSLINPEKFPVIVPNSLFSSQVIVNKSRAQWRASLTKIPLRIDDLDRIPVISEEIKSMLRSHPKIFLDMDAPYCYLSRIEDSFGELTIGCNLKNMKKDELYATEQDILLQAAKIIRKLGAELGRTVYQSTGH